MKNTGTILGGISLAAVAVLYVLHFSGPKSASKGADSPKTNGHTPGQIAYFEMDSVEQHYQFIKDARDEIKKAEENISGELNGMKKGYMGRVQQLQSQAPSMSQQDGERAQAEINQMQVNLQQREAKLTQELQEKQFKMMKDINEKIAAFLKGYNADKRFAYIISRSPGDFVYYADSAFNITKDVIDGLNKTYKETAPKK
ncbi:MAG: OmpH family outer membrane protein [Chitinophagaceae bacterium]|nr:OmpH family outer membrane protein [Chitinophagaceae bacterium]